MANIISNRTRTVDELIEAFQARGSDTDDLRDGAHEAHHALDSKLRGPWERERIHRQLLRAAGRDRSKLALFEINARAVEALVCRDFGIEYNLEYWSGLACIEAVKGVGIAFPSLGWFMDCVKTRIDSPMTRRYTDRVLAVGVHAHSALRSCAAGPREGEEENRG